MSTDRERSNQRALERKCGAVLEGPEAGTKRKVEAAEIGVAMSAAVSSAPVPLPSSSQPPQWRSEPVGRLGWT
jgi:hypothetical protein